MIQTPILQSAAFMHVSYIYVSMTIWSTITHIFYIYLDKPIQQHIHLFLYLCNPCRHAANVSNVYQQLKPIQQYIDCIYPCSQYLLCILAIETYIAIHGFVSLPMQSMYPCSQCILCILEIETYRATHRFALYLCNPCTMQPMHLMYLYVSMHCYVSIIMHTQLGKILKSLYVILKHSLKNLLIYCNFQIQDVFM